MSVSSSFSLHRGPPKKMELITEMQVTKVTALIVGAYRAADTIKESTRNPRQTARSETP